MVCYYNLGSEIGCQHGVGHTCRSCVDWVLPVHGGEVQQAASQAGLRPQAFLDASASLVPWTPGWQRLGRSALRDYPDRNQKLIRQRLAALHDLESSSVLPGNGAAELFTWAARDAAEQGLSLLLAPGFADYGRALRCWSASFRQQQLPLVWGDAFPEKIPALGSGDVLWLCNPHNPTGQLWSRAS